MSRDRVASERGDWPGASCYVAVAEALDPLLEEPDEPEEEPEDEEPDDPSDEPDDPEGLGEL